MLGLKGCALYIRNLHWFYLHSEMDKNLWVPKPVCQIVLFKSLLQLPCLFLSIETISPFHWVCITKYHIFGISSATHFI